MVFLYFSSYSFISLPEKHISSWVFNFLLFGLKGGGRGELQQEIDSIDNQISNIKKRLSSIVRECKFDSVQGFYKEFDAAKKENLE